MQNTQKQKLLFWLLPTPGNIIFTLLIISGVLYAQSAGAIPLTVTNATTATNVLIPYQGRLTDPDGNLLSGPQTMTFALYNVETGGESLWAEHRMGDANSVSVTDGLFNVMLGEVTSLDQSIITNNSVLYLGVTIGSNSEVSPRVEWGLVPYAVHALTVPDGSITNAKLADGAVTQNKIGSSVRVEPPDRSVTAAKLADRSVTQDKISTSVRVAPPDGSVTTAKLANGAVTQSKIASSVRIEPPNGSVTTTKLADGSVTPAKLNSAVKFAAIDSGYIHHGHRSSGWTLHEGNGERAYTANITFSRPFEKAPRVIVSRSYTDIRGNADQRFRISSQDITKNGFKLVFKTWGTAQVNSATAGWIAYTSP